MLPKMRVYRRDFDETKYLPFSIKFKGLIVKYNEIWNKVSNSLKTDLVVNLYIKKICKN